MCHVTHAQYGCARELHERMRRFPLYVNRRRNETGKSIAFDYNRFTKASVHTDFKMCVWDLAHFVSPIFLKRRFSLESYALKRKSEKEKGTNATQLPIPNAISATGLKVYSKTHISWTHCGIRHCSSNICSRGHNLCIRWC